MPNDIISHKTRSLHSPLAPAKSSEHNILSLYLIWLRGYGKLLLLIMSGLSLFRLVWFITYKKGDELSFFFTDFLQALWLGSRFDFSVVCYMTLPALLLWLVWLILRRTPLQFDIYHWQKCYWIFFTFILSLICLADFNFYGYFQDHFNPLIFGLINDDTQALLATFWKNYPLIKITLSLTLILWFLNRWITRWWEHEANESKTTQVRTPSRKFYQLNSWLMAPLFLVTFVLVSLGARGSLGLFPLEIMHTSISTNAFINTLSFSSAHALVHALQLHDQQKQSWNDNLVRLGYANNPLQALKDFHDLHGKQILNPRPMEYEVQTYTQTKKITTTSLQKPHIVFILMESWGADWINEHAPNFNILGSLEKHIKQDLFTTRILPSSVATIGSLGSLAIDLPHRLFSPFLTESLYLGVPFQQAPAHFLQGKGYQTHFIYGGNLGWRSIDKFLPKQGFQFLHGDHDIQKSFPSLPPENFNHDWGIHDEYVFKYAQALLDKSTEPQFLFILTTTNHPPYTLPKNYPPNSLQIPKSLLEALVGSPQLNVDRLKAFQYSNHQLGLFLDQLKSSSQESHTILAVTGDHSFYIRPYDNLQFFKKWGVPLLIHAPKKYLSDSGVLPHLGMGSHIDIFPTLYNLAFSETPIPSLGRDLLDPRLDPWSYHASSWTSFNEQYGVIINAKGNIVTGLCKPPPPHQEEYISCPVTEQHERLKLKLLSLMGTADYIFETNRRRNTSQNKEPTQEVKL